MDRIDLYTAAHKGLRAALFDAVTRVARTDFGADAETRESIDAVTGVLQFLSEYSSHDGAVLLPEIGVLRAELAAALCADRARIQGLELRCAQILARMDDAAGVARIALGRRLHAALALLTAEHLVHMDRLETQANRLLWAHRADDELRALRARVVEMIPPARLAAWLALVVPACAGPERVAIARAQSAETVTG